MTPYAALGLNGNFAGKYNRATILTIRPDQERRMNSEQLRKFKTLPTWNISGAWLRAVAWHRMSRKLDIYEFPTACQLWVIENRMIYPSRYLLLAMPPLGNQSGIVHGLGAWTVSKRDYQKVFG